MGSSVSAMLGCEEFSSLKHRSSHVWVDEVAVEKNGMFWIVFALNSKARCLVNVLLHAAEKEVLCCMNHIDSVCVVLLPVGCTWPRVYRCRGRARQPELLRQSCPHYRTLLMGLIETPLEKVLVWLFCRSASSAVLCKQVH